MTPGSLDLFYVKLRFSVYIKLLSQATHTMTLYTVIKASTYKYMPESGNTSLSFVWATGQVFYAPNFEEVGDILVSACPCVCLCACMGHRDIVLKLHVWIPHGKIADAYFWFSLNYLPLFNYGPLTNKGMKFCKCCISKSIIARNLKLVMLIGEDD